MQRVSAQFFAVFSLFLVTAIWGLTFVLVKWTIAEIDLYYFLFLRFLIASGLMALIFFKKLKGISWSTVKAGTLLGFLLTVSYIFQTEGLKFTTASNSAMITCLYMVIVPLCAYYYKKEKPKILSTIGVLVALPGSYFLTQGSLAGINVGDVLTFIVAIAFAWHIVLTGEFTKKHSLIPLVIIQFIFATIVCGAAMIVKGVKPVAVPPIGWLTLFITAVFATCFAFIVQTWAQRTVDSTRTGIIFAMEAVFGALFGCLLGGEVLTQVASIGALLMVAGMIISEIHPIVRAIYSKIVG